MARQFQNLPKLIRLGFRQSGISISVIDLECGCFHLISMSSQPIQLQSILSRRTSSRHAGIPFMTIEYSTMDGEAGPLDLDSLPDEILQHILSYCSPQDIVESVQRTSKRFKQLSSEPLLWRYHCRTDFTYWDSRHRITQKLAGPVGDVDWKTLYTYRHRVSRKTTNSLDSILEGQANRIVKFKAIAEFGYDAKDTLLRHCRTPDTADDVLARRHAIPSRTSLLASLTLLQILCDSCLGPFA